MEKKRSVGVSVLGVLFIVIGAMGLVGYLAALHHIFHPIWLVALVVYAHISFGIGILGLRPWGRITALWSSICFIIVRLANVGNDLRSYEKIQEIANPGNKVYLESIFRLEIILSIIPMAFYLFIIYFLTRSKVKEQFK